MRLKYLSPSFVFSSMTVSIMPDAKKRNIATLVKEYGKRLFAFVRGRVGTREDAEDILQDVWYQLGNLANLDDLENAGSWLFRVARNKVTDRYRRKKTDSLEDIAYEDEDGEYRFRELLLLDATADPELAFFKEAFWDTLLTALDELPENQRSVFVRNELEDTTLRQIAEESGENLKTIISRKGYAVKHLRAKLASLYQELYF